MAQVTNIDLQKKASNLLYREKVSAYVYVRTIIFLCCIGLLFIIVVLVCGVLYCIILFVLYCILLW